MSNDPLTKISTRRTPQSRRTSARQVRNNAGGFVFAIGPRERVRRFLTLGSTGGTYYVSEDDLTLANVDALRESIAAEPRWVVDEVVAISTAGRAPRQQPALFALAAVAAFAVEPEDRNYAASKIRDVARTGYTLFKYAQYSEQLHGWGRVHKRGMASWYLNSDVSWLAYQAVKYRQRDGWTHRDVLRLAHPKAAETDHDRRALFDWMCGRLPRPELVGRDDLRIVEGYERARHADVREVAELVREYRLPCEALPDAAMNRTDVWEALLDNGVPQTALLRQLPRLTRIGLLPNSGGRTNEVVHQLTNVDMLRRGRIHPLNVLVAQKTYAQGHSERGSSTWMPTRRIVDALDAAFYAAYGAIEPTGKRIALALDVSGSMGASVDGMPLSAREVCAAMALVTANVESEYSIMGFTSGTGGWSNWNDGQVSELTISPRQRLDDVVRYTRDLPFGGTDCALPFTYALAHNLKFDAVVIYTDSESWAGPIHVHEALRQYRDQTGIATKLIVVGTTATEFTVADPQDAGSLNVAGFDATVPNVISDFVRGDA